MDNKTSAKIAYYNFVAVCSHIYKNIIEIAVELQRFEEGIRRDTNAHRLYRNGRI